MAFNGAGVFSRVYNWATDAFNAVPITASRMDTEMDGFAAGLSDCMTRDGQSPPTANIPMGGFRLTGLASGTASTDAATVGQITNSSGVVGLFSGMSNQNVDASVNLIQTSGYGTTGVGEGAYISDSLANSALAAAHPRCCSITANGRYFRLLDDNGWVNVDAGKSAADTDDTAAFLAVAAYARAVGAVGIRLSARVWTIASPAVGVLLWTNDYALLYNGLRLDTNGATLRTVGNAGTGRGIDLCGQSQAKTVVTAATLAGDKVLHVTSTTGFVAGGWAHWRLGDIAFDPPETYNSGWSLIESVNAGALTVTLAQAIPIAFTAGQLAAAVNNKHLYATTPIIDDDFGDFIYDNNFADGYSGSQTGVTVKFAVRPKFGSISIRRGGYGFIAQYVKDFHVARVVVSDYEDRSNPNLGSGVRVAEASGYIGQVVCDRIGNGAVGGEAGCDLRVGELVDIVPAGLVAGRYSINFQGDCRAMFDHVRIEGYGGPYCSVYQAATNSVVTMNDLTVRTAVDPLVLGRMGHEITGTLTYEIAGQVPEVYDMADAFWWEQRVFLRDAMAVTYTTPKNCICATFDLLASSDVVLADLDFVNIGRQGGLGGYASNLIPGSIYRYDPIQGSNSPFFNSTRGLPFEVYVDTAAARNLDGSGKWVAIRMLLVPNRNAAGSGFAFGSTGTIGDADASRIFDNGKTIRKARASVVVPALAANAESGWLDIALTGAAAGNKPEAYAIGDITTANLAITAARIKAGGGVVQFKIKDGGAGYAGGTIVFAAIATEE